MILKEQNLRRHSSNTFKIEINFGLVLDIEVFLKLNGSKE